MKTFLKILILIVFPEILWAQEPVVFHFNFSLEKEYGKGWYDPNLSNDLTYVTITIYNPDNYLVYKKQFEKRDFFRDEYGNCLLADTTYSLFHNSKEYSLKLNYQLINKQDDSSQFYFNFPDTVDQLALEIYFDQTKIKNLDYMWMSFEKVYFEEYALNKDPKPVLLVKSIEKSNLSLLPHWFTNSRLNPRPIYYLQNNGPSPIFTLGVGIEDHFSGNLQVLDSLNNYKKYFFGFECGNVGGANKVLPGETIHVSEGALIGQAQKMKEGFYKYSVGYLDNEGEIKKVSTFFRVIYSK